MLKKLPLKFAVVVISRTFAPAFGKEAVMLDMMLQAVLHEVFPSWAQLSRLSHERGPSGGSPRKDPGKNSGKKLRRTFGGLENSPYLCTRFSRSPFPKDPLPEKTSKKVLQKFGRYAKNSLPLHPLSDKKREAVKRRDL